HHFRVIGGDGVGQVLQQHGFAGARRSDDEAALSFANGREQVHDTGAYILANGFQLHPLLRIKWSEVVEQNLVARLFGGLKVDRLNFDQRKIFFAFMRRTHLAADGVSGFQVEFADLRWRNVNIVGAGKVVVVRGTQEAVAVRQDFQHSFSK